MIPSYRKKMKVDSDLDKINKIVSIVSIIKNGNLGVLHIRPKCVEVLSYYILFGCNKDTKKILEESGFSKANVHQITSELRKLGYLVKDTKNLHLDYLSPEIQTLRDYFFDKENKKKFFLIELME